jgi:hypothetical protein
VTDIVEKTKRDVRKYCSLSSYLFHMFTGDVTDYVTCTDDRKNVNFRISLCR